VRSWWDERAAWCWKNGEAAGIGKAGGDMHKSTAKKTATVSAVVSSDPDSLVRFADLLKLRGLAATTQAEYLRYVRKLAVRTKRDPSELDEPQVRAHLLHLKEAQQYSPSSMRTAVAAMRAFYGLHLGRDWKLFDLVRSPSPLKLPEVLTREEVARLFAVIREPRFRIVLRLIYACGLRVSEAVTLEVTDIKRDGPRLHLWRTKGLKERLVPLPLWVLSRVARLLAHASAPTLGVPWRRSRLAGWRVVARRLGVR
jgi:site-specific recombinase XerD